MSFENDVGTPADVRGVLVIQDLGDGTGRRDLLVTAKSNIV